MLYCTLNWSRLHNFIHDILLGAKAICWSHMIEVSTQDCLGMGWRLAASCKKVWPLRQSTPFQEPGCCCIWIARFIYHTVKASDADVTETKFSCRRKWGDSPRYDHVWALCMQSMALSLYLFILYTTWNKKAILFSILQTSTELVPYIQPVNNTMSIYNILIF